MFDAGHVAELRGNGAEQKIIREVTRENQNQRAKTLRDPKRPKETLRDPKRPEKRS